MNYGKTYWGIVRSSFLVGPDGRVAHVWPKVKPEDHAVEVLAALCARPARLRPDRDAARLRPSPPPACTVAGRERGLARGGRRAKPRAA